MTIHVNIGDAKTRLSELVAAAVRGEEVVLDKAGTPQVRLTPVAQASDIARARQAEKRRQALGMFQEAFAGIDLSVRALKDDRTDPDERHRRKLGDPA